MNRTPRSSRPAALRSFHDTVLSCPAVGRRQSADNVPRGEAHSDRAGHAPINGLQVCGRQPRHIVHSQPDIIAASYLMDQLMGLVMDDRSVDDRSMASDNARGGMGLGDVCSHNHPHQVCFSIQSPCLTNQTSARSAMPQCTPNRSHQFSRSSR